MGHSDLECPTPAARDEDGKLPYDLNLRAPEEKKRRPQSFAAAAAAESFGTGSSSNRRHTSLNKSGGKVSRSADGSRHSESQVGDSEEPEVQSPLKHVSERGVQEMAGKVPAANKQLVFEAMEEDQANGPRKRKSKQVANRTQMPDLNIPLGASNALVPVGLVTSRVSQIGASDSGGSMIETLKKQRRGNSQIEGSAAAASGSPRRAP